jgi:cobalamin biosynthesis protein CobT
VSKKTNNPGADTMKKNNDLTGYCAKIASTFARKAGVSVRFEGKVAKTNGKTIWLPANAEEIVKTEAGRAKIDGLLDHEWLHIFFDGKDKNAGRKSVAQFTAESTDSRHRLLNNVWDDVRIERCAPYEGVRQNLNKMNVQTIADMNVSEAMTEESFMNFAKGLILRARGVDTSMLHDRVNSRLDAMSEVIALGANAETSDDVNAASIATLEALKDWAKDDAKDENDESDSDTDSDESGDDESDSDSDSDSEDTDKLGDAKDGNNDETADENDENSDESDDTTDADGPSDPGFDDDDSDDDSNTDSDSGSADDSDSDDDTDESNDSGSGDDNGDENDEGNDGDTSNSDSTPTHDNNNDGAAEGDEPDAPDFGSDEDLPEDIMKDEVENDIEEMAGEAQSDPRRRRHLASPSVAARDKVVEIDVTASSATVTKFKNSMKGKASALKNKLVQAIFARRASRSEGDKESGRLDNRALASVKLGNRRVYSQRVEGDDTTTAVTLLIDCSGSMTNSRRGGESKMSMAAKSAYKLGEALDSIGIDFSVFGWSNPHSYSYRSEDTFFNRTAPFWFIKVKDFGEKFKRVTDRFATLASYEGENNDDGGAVRWAAKNLLGRKADRHVLIVLSDGRPASNAHDMSLLTEDLHVAVREVTEAGIDLIGIGIQDSSVERFYPRNVVVNDLDQLPAGVMKQLRSAMMDRKGKGRRARR